MLNLFGWIFNFNVKLGGRCFLCKKTCETLIYKEFKKSSVKNFTLTRNLWGCGYEKRKNNM